MSSLPKDDAARKRIKIFDGFIKYFPDAIAACAELSCISDRKHSPDKDPDASPVWNKDASKEQRNSQARHLLDEAKEGPLARDPENGVLHAVANMWRACAQVQTLADQGHNVFAVTNSYFESGDEDDETGLPSFLSAVPPARDTLTQARTATEVAFQDQMANGPSRLDAAFADILDRVMREQFERQEARIREALAKGPLDYDFDDLEFMADIARVGAEIDARKRWPNLAPGWYVEFRDPPRFQWEAVVGPLRSYGDAEQVANDDATGDVATIFEVH